MSLIHTWYLTIVSISIWKQKLGIYLIEILVSNRLGIWFSDILIHSSLFIIQLIYSQLFVLPFRRNYFIYKFYITNLCLYILEVYWDIIYYSHLWTSHSNVVIQVYPFIFNCVVYSTFVMLLWLSCTIHP